MVCRRAILLTSREEFIYNNDGSIKPDSRWVIDDKLSVAMRADVASSGQNDHRWQVRANQTDVAWIRDRRARHIGRNGMGSRGDRLTLATSCLI